MSSRPQLKPYKVIINQAMTGTVYSQPTIITNLSKVSYDVSWSGGSSPIGTLQVQVSNTYSQDASGAQLNAGNWNTLTLSSAPTVSGNSGNGFIEIDSLSSYAIRLVYVPTSGSGTLNATVTCKVS